MKNHVLALLGFGVIALSAAPAYAATIVLTPADALYVTDTTSNLGTTSAIETAFALTTDSLDGFVLYYKKEVDGGGEEGSLASSYTTTFANDPNDPQEATISYDSPGPSISCPFCFLIVKDGNATPAQYYLSLDTWNGTDTIQLNAFWPNQGAISNVAIWSKPDEGPDGPSGVPEPSALALFGAGLLGLGWAARRRRSA